MALLIAEGADMRATNDVSYSGFVFRGCEGMLLASLIAGLAGLYAQRLVFATAPLRISRVIE